jgi:hypothetical protein
MKIKKEIQGHNPYSDGIGFNKSIFYTVKNVGLINQAPTECENCVFNLSSPYNITTTLKQHYI